MSPSDPPACRLKSRVRAGTIILWVGLSVLVIMLAAAMWVGVRAFLAKGELESAVPLASEIQSQVVSGDGHAANQTAEQLAEHALNAARLTSDPVWRSFEFVPMLRPNLTAVRQLAAVVDDISQNAVTPLVETAGAIDLGAFKPVQGSINVQPLVDAQPEIAAVIAAVAEAERDVQSIETAETLSVVQSAAAQLESALADAAGSLAAVDRAVRLVPAMLGATGPRNYLLLFQNPAELRATGGIPGALALIHTDNGRIDLTEQASTSDFPHYDSPVLELPLETRGIYGDITGEYIQDVNLTPDFPLSAKLAREMWRLQFGVEADGVLSIDPVALSYLLRATGPITLPTGGVLSADNAVQLLLSDAYARYERPADQDVFFAAAAASVFSAVSSGNVDPKALIEALAQAGSEHRVLVWSAHEEDQAVLAGTTLTGALPVSDKDTKRFGVYLNDATGAKMGIYLDVQVGVGQVTCRLDGRPSYAVEVTLTNTAPGDAANALPEYVTGGGNFGVTPGNVKTIVLAYGAPGMQSRGLTRDGAVVPYHPATDSGYPVSSIAVELAPGETTVLRYGWLGAEPFDGEIVARTTPAVSVHQARGIEMSCESPL